ncbi:MAG: hypothetical protein ACJ75M_08505, partial [Actinomycetes bacterium]
CQLGLQYVPDRAAAWPRWPGCWRPVGGWRRWCGGRSSTAPGFALLAEALDRHVGPAAGATMRAPFGLGDEETLRGQVAGAGFQESRPSCPPGRTRPASSSRSRPC